MKLIKTITALIVAAGLSACASSSPISETATRSASEPSQVLAAELNVLSAGWSLADVRVRVPGELKVSEANRYYPIADIVWRGDPFGSRHEQVATLIDDGLTLGLTHLRGDRPVYFDITVSRFHSLSEKARYSVGGVHNIVYTLTVVDATTGLALHGPMTVKTDLKAYGGEQAFAAERRGETQKVRIKSHLASLMRKSFSGGQELRVVARADNTPADAYTGVTR